MKTLLARSVRAWHAMPLLLSVASVLSVRSPGQVILPGPAIRSIQAGSGITVTTNGTSRTVTYSGSSGDITGGAVTGGMLTVSESAGILTYGLTTNSVNAAVDVLARIADQTIAPDRIEGDGTLTIVGTDGMYIQADASGLSPIEVSGITTTNSIDAATINATDAITIGGTNVLTEASQINGANITNGTAIAGLVDMPSGHTAGVTNLVGIAGDGVTPVFVPTSSTWQGFIAYRGTSNQSMPQSATTAMIYNAEERDTLGLHDTSTGYFRPNKTGLWRIYAWGIFQPTSGNPAAAGSYSAMSMLRVSDSASIAVLYTGRTISTSFPPTYGSPGVAIVNLTSGVDYKMVYQNGDTKDWSFIALQSASRLAAEFISE